MTAIAATRRFKLCEWCGVATNGPMLCHNCKYLDVFRLVGGSSHGDSQFGRNGAKAMTGLRKALKFSRQQIAERRASK